MAVLCKLACSIGAFFLANFASFMEILYFNKVSILQLFEIIDKLASAKSPCDLLSNCTILLKTTFFLVYFNLGFTLSREYNAN